MSEKPTITRYSETVYIKLNDETVVAIYGEGLGVSLLAGRVTDFGFKPLTSLSSEELWEAVREVILERAKDEGH